MKHDFWLSSGSSNLESAVAVEPSHATLGAASPTDFCESASGQALQVILSELSLSDRTLSLHSTYQDLAHLFDSESHLPGVLIVSPVSQVSATDTSSNRPTAVGMVSRQQLLQWRSHSTQWAMAQSQPLFAVGSWWQTALAYHAVDSSTPLQTVITQLLDRPRATASEPIVVSLPNQFAVLDVGQLFATYARRAQQEQSSTTHAELESLRRQHQLILNAVGEGVYGVDLHGHATFINPAGAQMIGWEMDEIIGKSMHALLHHSKADCSPYPTAECPIYAAFHDGIIHRVSDEVFWRKDGTSFPVEYISTPMHDEQGKLIGAVVAFRDITKRKWAEAVLHRANEELEQKVRERTAKLRQVNEQLKELSDVRSRMVSMVCHEFRNPLNNILLSISSLGRYDTQLSSEQKENFLQGIQANVERMTQMIDDILVIGRVEANRIDIQVDAIDLVQFCCELTTELSLSHPNHTIQFVTRNKTLIADMDERLLRSILTNMLSNSIRYSPHATPIEFKLRRYKQMVVFHIGDRGIGIPPEDLPYLFEPFHRGKNVSNIPGTGLGLSIVKEFVELLHGDIKVASQLGKGTTFRISLPLRPSFPHS
ncbi:PAS domain-containing sensor histidine kinase [Leptolyngbya sp. AN02str]|uniref:PAS domain-containing sensor histidine kinase n=1 Tax=Leptolyngbya sp. AN02str TaxID=3423363 RepID=UPI003D31C2D6